MAEESRELVAQPITDIKAGSGLEGSRALFLPTTYIEAKLMAHDMATSTAVPKHLRGSEGNCLAVLMQAARWGLDPFAVASKTYFINDQIAFEAQLVNAVVISSRILEGRLSIQFTGDGQSLRCNVTGKIRGDPEPKVKTQSYARAKRDNGSPLWRADPEQQLGYYTTRAWARLHASDVLMGVYTPDEILEGAADKLEQQRGEPRPDAPRREDFVAEEERQVDDREQAQDAEFTPVDDAGGAELGGIDMDAAAVEELRLRQEAEAGDDAAAPAAEEAQPAEGGGTAGDLLDNSGGAAEGTAAKPVEPTPAAAKPAEKPMPKNAAEWEGWKRNVLLEIGKRKTVEGLDRLKEAQLTRLQAAPPKITNDVENSFLDKRIDLKENPNDR